MRIKDINKKSLILTIIIVIILIIVVCVSISNIIKAKHKQEIFLPIAEENSSFEFEEADNQIIVDITNPNEETIEQTQIVKNNQNKNVSNTATYYIKVNYGAQVVTIYSKDAQGNYTVPVKAMVCSTGTHTPKSGVYTIPQRWEWGALQGNVYGHYVTKITGNILFHSVPYKKMRDPASLEYWEYDKLGSNASLGCVRLKIEDAKWIYENCKNGTKVEFYSSSDPGPLGKPSAKKISSYPDYLKNWDPTDTNPNNPWLSYKELGNNQNSGSTENKPEESTPESKPNPEKPTQPNNPDEQTKPDNPEKPSKPDNQVNGNTTNDNTTNESKPNDNVTNESTADDNTTGKDGK